MEAIKALYARHVFEGKRTIESVPTIIREDVRILVEEMNAQQQPI